MDDRAYSNACRVLLDQEARKQQLWHDHQMRGLSVRMDEMSMACSGVLGGLPGRTDTVTFSTPHPACTSHQFRNGRFCSTCGTAKPEPKAVVPCKWWQRHVWIKGTLGGDDPAIQCARCQKTVRENETGFRILRNPLEFVPLEP